MRYDMPIDRENSALQEIGNALGSEYDQFRPFFSAGTGIFANIVRLGSNIVDAAY